MSKYRVVDLFSGAGGLTFGFYYNLVNNQFKKRENIEFVFANEFAPQAVAAFNKNYGDDIPMIAGDICGIIDKEIEERLNGEEVDVIIGGPPCQSFSTVGQRKYDDRAKLSKCGYIAFSKLKLEDLQGDENLLPPNVYMNLFDEEYNGMISLYTRGLGMILNYEENWINVKEFSLAQEELLITLFVPDTTADIVIGGETIHLGEYLRQREEADHMKWDDDPAKMKVKCVKQIKNSVDTAVRKHFHPEQFEQHCG